MPAYAAPLGPDPDALAELAAGEGTARAAAELDELVGDRKLLFRSDRIDLSKNIVRGFHVYDALLERSRSSASASSSSRCSTGRGPTSPSTSRTSRRSTRPLPA